MMKLYVSEEKKHQKEYKFYTRLDNLINTTDFLIIIIISPAATSVTLNITIVSIIVVPIVAGIGCITAVVIRICSSCLRK